MAIRESYFRRRSLKRLRHSDNLLDWLAGQATRLATTVAVIYARLLSGQSTRQIAALTGTYPKNTVKPEVTGTAAQGQTLTATNGTWTGTATITYTRRWLRYEADGSSFVPISGATDTTYELTEDDVGKKIACEVTASNSLGKVVETSNLTATVVAS